MAGHLGHTSEPTLVTEELSIKQNMVWNSVGSFVYMLSQWVMTYLVTILCGYGVAGVFSIATSLSGTLYPLSHFTMRSFQASDIRSEYSNLTYVRSRYVTCIAAFFVCIVLSVYGGYESEAFICILLYMLFRSTEALSDVYQGILQRGMRMDYIGKSFLIKSVLELIVFVVAIVSSGSLILALAGITVVSAGVVLLYDRVRADRVSRLVGGSAAKDIVALIKACAPYAIQGFALTAVGMYPRLVLDQLQGTEVLGVYSSIAMPVSIIQVMANYIFAPLTTPFARLIDSGQYTRFREQIWKITGLMVLLCAVSIPASNIVGPFFLKIMFGETIIPYTSALAPLVLCGIATAFAWFVQNLLTVLRSEKVLVFAGLVSLAVSLLSSRWLVVAFSMDGASFALLLSLLSFIVISLIDVFRRIMRMAADVSSE